MIVITFSKRHFAAACFLSLIIGFTIGVYITGSVLIRPVVIEIKAPIVPQGVVVRRLPDVYTDDITMYDNYLIIDKGVHSTGDFYHGAPQRLTEHEHKAKLRAIPLK